jgi:hypothetical protein
MCVCVKRKERRKGEVDKKEEKKGKKGGERGENVREGGGDRKALPFCLLLT